ncbi:nucleotidyltransferase domain-containing protein [Chitinophagaceae bacterium LB-8]|uniref:Nucleotidyltransferase domain-containing protein n=1 Tax=Paraflavisolibacter caeni TaxID=2982496 RepID=A0A9X2XXY4_9BACT|nr:nucleotidyltransferase domain-containing protein [Paraflavisolibacter caeni]MCU7551614.1 nucleotidyltransferase domain-containing protein [Paraflavisolibacter caeni]
MDQWVEQHVPKIQELMRRYGVERAYLFGSAAKGTMTESSDVDFIIRFPAHMHYESYANNYFALAQALEELLKKDVELVTERTLQNPYLLQNINQHKVQLL